jgi:hypothetical protein
MATITVDVRFRMLGDSDLAKKLREVQINDRGVTIDIDGEEYYAQVVKATIHVLET